ncbi:MAG: YybH family protein [Sphingomicrobium sp.]
MKSIYLPIAVGLALTGCDMANKSDAPANGAASTDTAAVEQALKDNEAAWQADYAAKDADKLAGHYADDAALANPGAPLLTDTASRRKALEEFAADPNLKVEFASNRIGVAQSGELAYTRGHYSMTFTDPATKQPKSDAGSYLTVYRKQADGSWKAVEDFITPGPAAVQ